MPSLNQGKLVTWKPDKGFGFIRPDDGSKDVFVHFRDFGDIARSPQVGDVIRYQRIRDRTGRYKAADVQVAGLTRRSRPRDDARPASRSTVSAVAAALAFAVVLSLLFAFTALPIFVPMLYLMTSIATFLLYAFDKAAAMNRRRRTSENILLLVGLLGGWPGALIAQSMFRHKSRKIQFLAPFWITVALNSAFLVWACTEKGAAAIRLAMY